MIKWKNNTKHRQLKLVMKANVLLVVFLLLQDCIVSGENAQVSKGSMAQANNPLYQADFESLETINPVPEWFKDAKFGIYFHWGVYSVPVFSNEWYPRNMYREGSVEHQYHLEHYGALSQWPYHISSPVQRISKAVLCSLHPSSSPKADNIVTMNVE